MSWLAASALFVTAVTALILSRPQKSAKNPMHADLNRIIEMLETPEGQSYFHSMFMRECSACHGPDLAGQPPRIPALISPALQERGAGMRVIQTIMNGGNGMPPFGEKLSKADVMGLALWILGKQEQDSQTAGQRPAGGSGSPTTPPTMKQGGPSGNTWEISGQVNVGQWATSHPQAAVFVFAKRNEAMTGPPTLALRLPVSSTLTFSLTEAQAMMGQPPSVGDTLFIRARVDLDGNLMTREGEPESEIVKVMIQGKNSGISLKIPAQTK